MHIDENGPIRFRRTGSVHVRPSFSKQPQADDGVTTELAAKLARRRRWEKD